jgi:hypothetical protein
VAHAAQSQSNTRKDALTASKSHHCPWLLACSELAHASSGMSWHKQTYIHRRQPKITALHLKSETLKSDSVYFNLYNNKIKL